MTTRRTPLRARAPHVVRDFNTLSALVNHAHQELGATHSSGTEAHTKLYFPRGGQHPYEEATVWRKAGYWHAQGPGARAGVAGLPAGAKALGARGRQAAETRRQKDFTTIYVTPKSRDDIERLGFDLEKSIGAEVALGQGDYINIFSRDSGVINKAVEWIGTRNVVEISPPQKKKTAVRDYIAVDRHDRTIGGPFKSHDEAKRAAGGSGVVQFVPAGSSVTPRGAREERSAHHHIPRLMRRPR